MLQDTLLFLVGILVGGMNAIAGGGMLIGFPALLATGMPALAANATSYLVVMPGNIAAAFGFRKYLKRISRRYLLLIIPTVLGAAIGTLLLRNTSHDKFAEFIPWLIIFAVALFAFQPFLYKYLHKHLHGPVAFRQKIGPLFIVGLAVFPLSIYGGYFGAGFGFIMLSFLGFTKLHNHIHRMNALKNICVIFVSTTSLTLLIGSGLINWRYGLIMGAGNLIGGYYGALASQKVSGHAIRVFIIFVGVITAAYLGLRSY